MAERALEQIERRLDILGVDDLAVAGFITLWRESDGAERIKLRALSDRRLLRVIAQLPAQQRVQREHGAIEEVNDLYAANTSVPNMVAWVGDGPECFARARLVIAKEDTQPFPRKTLLAAMLDLLEAE